VYAASNPANVKVQIGHFLKCDLKDLIILVVALVLAAVIAIFNWKPALIVLGIGLVVPVMSVFTAKQVFAEGDVLPALVIDGDRNLVALLVDLSKGGKPIWAVKVLRQPLGRVTGGPFETGTRLAFVGLYNAPPSATQWKNVGGYLVNAGTTSGKTIKRVVASITDEQWSRLKKAVRTLEEPYATGLHEL
jgi:hypothetical protein